MFLKLRRLLCLMIAWGESRISDLGFLAFVTAGKMDYCCWGFIIL